MNESSGSCPMPHRAVVDAYFLEHRARLIDIAAFLDRVGRAANPPAEPDYRVTALLQALALLTDGGGDYARRVLEHFSDPTTELLPAAPGKGAAGAYAHGESRGS